MTTAAELLALAERTEALTGPCRETDGCIWYACVEKPGAAGRLDRDMIGRWPAFTGSLDAAMSLVPEGWKPRQINFSAPCADDRKWHLNLHGGPEGQNCFVGRAATPALALTAAALRARAAQVTP